MAALDSKATPPSANNPATIDVALLPPGQRPSDAWLLRAAQMDGADLLAKMQSSSAGLSWTVAHERIEQYGPNVAVPHKVAAWWKVLWHSFCNPFNYILLILGIISWRVAEVNDPRVLGVPADALLMFVMVAISTGLRFWQDFRSSVKAEVLRKMVRNQATVYRTENEGVERTPHSLDPLASEILMQDIAPGDIIKLSAGDIIPAEMRLLESRDLFVQPVLH